MSDVDQSEPRAPGAATPHAGGVGDSDRNRTAGFGGGHGGGHGPRWMQEADSPNLTKVLIIAGLALVSFVVSVVLATAELHSVEKEQLAGGKEPPLPAVHGHAEIGIVNQIGFEIDARTAALLAEKHKWLTSRGPVDPKQPDVEHIPIDEAMQRVVSGEMPK